MLRPQLSSIKQQHVFNALRTKGIKYYGSCFLLVTLIEPDSNLTSVSLGIKTTRKVGNAVYRNKIKRRLKHIFRDITPSFKGPQLNILVVPRKEFHDMEFAKLATEIRNYYQTKFPQFCNFTA